ncbi:MAG TPA: CYTH domain-containing protein [Candidatus Angelobacter sp.]|nr:CYTH domain-containing protein [Candidatus Angelobacter sp.]
MALEVELKYAADEPAMNGLATVDRLGPAEIGPARQVTEFDRYLDTADGRLAAASWACRLRERGGGWRISLKGPAAAGTGGGLHRRPELEGPATQATDPREWPPSEARDLVDRIRAGQPLDERFALRQDRTERPVNVDGSEIGTLSLDEIRVLADGTERGRMRAVELELHGSGHGDARGILVELDRALRGVAGLRPDDRTKLEHALDLIGDR